MAMVEHRMLMPHTPLEVSLRQPPHVIVRGSGCRVWDSDGREFIEGVAGLWCANLGFSCTALADAAAEQLRRLPFYGSFSNRTHTGALRLADELLELFCRPMDRVFFANSGSEANDTALKLVWYYNNAVGRPLKKKLLAFRHGYHGVTVGAGSLTGLEHVHDGFDLPLAPVVHVPTPDFAAARPGESEEAFAERSALELEHVIQREHPDSVAAMIVEPVLGAGGLVIPPAGYFDRVQETLRRHDILLVVDEIITGFGRTGRMFGCETFGLEPDLVTLAKGLSAAYAPISAVLISGRVMAGIVKQSTDSGSFGHGFTYSGHPLATAIALATLEQYRRPGFLDQVRARAALLGEHLEAIASHPGVSRVRHLGLLGAVEVPAGGEEGGGARRLVAAAQDEGLVVRAMRDTVVLAPPLVIEPEDLDELFRRLRRALDAVHVGDLAGGPAGRHEARA